MKILKQIICSLVLLISAFGAHSADAEKAMQFIAEGDAMFKKAFYQQAQVSYQKAARYTTDMESLKIKIAKTFYYLQNYKTAMQIIDEVLEIDSGIAQALLLKGELLEQAGQNDIALQYYNMAQYYAPDDEQIKIKMGSVLRKMNLEQEASVISQQVEEQLAEEKINEELIQQNKPQGKGN